MRHCRLEILMQILTVAITGAETPGFAETAYYGSFNESHTNESPNAFAFDDDPGMPDGWHGTMGPGFEFLKNVNKEIVKEFGLAWRIAMGGMAAQEGVVLIFRGTDGVYRARTLRPTHEYKKCTFTWDPVAIAVVHTHPNNGGPRPSPADKELAHRRGVPVFTITRQGMYVYEPFTRNSDIVLDGLDWLNPSKFTAENYRKLTSRFFAVYHRVHLR